MEIDGIQNQFVKPSGLRKLYEDQLRDLKRIADQMRRQRVRRNGLIHTSTLSPFFLFTSQKTENKHTERGEGERMKERARIGMCPIW